MEIRPGVISDIPNIKPLLIESWVNHAKNNPDLLDEERMRESDIEGYYRKAMDSPSQSIVLVAEEDGTFAGFIKADVKEIPPFFKHPKILFIDDICVVPEFRRKGAAFSLLAGIEQAAQERGIKRLQARVYTFNESMQRLLDFNDWTIPHSTWDKILD